MKHAQELDPIRRVQVKTPALASFLRRDWDQALAQLLNLAELGAPNFSARTSCWGGCICGKGMLREALADWKARHAFLLGAGDVLEDWRLCMLHPYRDW